MHDASFTPFCPNRRILPPLLQTFLLITLILVTVPFATAQYRASIQGIVTDPSGAVVPGATLTLTDTANGHVVTATSNSSGIYNFNALPPDHFVLTAVAKGFKTKTIENLQIIPEQANAVNVQLEVGTVSENVTVSGENNPNLDTQTATISATISSNQIQHMPAFGRDVMTLTQLAPGVFGDGSQGASGGVRSIPGTNQGGSGSSDGIFKTENGPQVIANGNQTNTNGVTLDGVSTSSVTWGGTTVVTPSEESIQSVKVTSNAYNAEFGRFTGTQIQVTSKSGTNDLHGSLFFTANRPGMNAYQRWNGPNSVGAPAAGQTPAQRGLNRDQQILNTYGGSIGGPIWKNKVFGFFSYETLRRNAPTGTAIGWYETPDLRAMAPAGSNAAKYLSNPGMPVNSLGLATFGCADLGLSEGPNCHYIAGKGLDIGSPLTTPLGTYDTSRTGSNQPGHGSGLDGVADIAEYATLSPANSVASQYYGRLDMQATQNDRVSFMIYWDPVDKHSINGPARAENTWTNSAINDAFTGLWNHIFSPSLLNEARVNAAGWRWNEVGSNPKTPFGLPSISWGDAHGMFPSGTISSFAPNNPSIFNQWTYGYQDIVTKTWGRHNTRFGGSLTRLYYLNTSPGAARPSYNFGNLWDFLNDAPYKETGNFNPSNGTPTANRQDNRNNFFGFFVQDDWKVTPTLTLNLGLRYDYFGPYYDKDNTLRVVNFGSSGALVSGLAVRLQQNLYTVQKGNFGPQFGFAWAPDALQRKLVIRGGYGLNYNQNEMAITASGHGNPGNTLNYTFCCDDYTGTTATGGSILYQLPSDSHNIFGYPANSSARTTYAPSGLPLTGTVGVTAFDPHARSIQTSHYSLEAEYELAPRWVATLGYQGSNSHHLLLQEDLNVVAAAHHYALNPAVNRVGYYGNIGGASYNAMLADLKHNFSQSFQVEGQFTWSNSMDNGSQPYYQDPYPYNMQYSWGRSDYNVKDAFKIFGMYQPNFFHQQLLHSVADGWTLTGIYNWHTGFPWTPTWNSNVNPFYGGGGQGGSLRPAAYNGQAGHNLSNSAFESGPNSTTANAAKTNPALLNQNFTNGLLSYFTLPAVNNAGGAFGVNTEVPVPQAPGVARNSFDGPHYAGVDASLTKGFHLPKLPALGENSIFEVRLDAFNLFNQTNLNGISTSIGTGGGNTGSNFAPNVYFGQATGALGARIIDMQARFSF